MVEMECSPKSAWATSCDEFNSLNKFLVSEMTNSVEQALIAFVKDSVTYVINYCSVNNGNSRPTGWVIVEQIFKLLYMEYSVNEFPVGYLREVLVRIHWWFKI